MGVSFGDHFVADYVEHRAACESKGKGQDCSGKLDYGVAEECAKDFCEACAKGDEEGSFFGDACG